MHKKLSCELEYFIKIDFKKLLDCEPSTLLLININYLNARIKLFSLPFPSLHYALSSRTTSEYFQHYQEINGGAHASDSLGFLRNLMVINPTESIKRRELSEVSRMTARRRGAFRIIRSLPVMK